MAGIGDVNWAQQGLNFGSSLLSFGLSQLGSAADSKRAFKYWNRQRDRIMQEAYEAYERQRADARKDTLEQYQLDVAAKKNAGLNPALGEGQGAVTMSQPNIDAQDNGAIQSQSGQVQYSPLLAAQLENIKADTLDKQKSAGLKVSQIDLNKQAFDQNLEKFPIFKRIWGADATLKEVQSDIGREDIRKLQKQCDILDETLKQTKITTDNMTKDNQVKAVEVYLRVMRAMADYSKAIEEVKEVRSRTSLNYASAQNQRAQAWLTPYQARNLTSSTALNYAKVKTEGTQQRLNNMLYKEAGQRMLNWQLKNIHQLYDNRIRGFQADLTETGINPECSNVWAQAMNVLGANIKYNLNDRIISPMCDTLGSWFGTAITDDTAKSMLNNGLSKIQNGISSAWSWYSNGVQQGIRKSKEWKFNENNKLGFEYYK